MFYLRVGVGVVGGVFVVVVVVAVVVDFFGSVAVAVVLPFPPRRAERLFRGVRPVDPVPVPVRVCVVVGVPLGPEQVPEDTPEETMLGLASNFRCLQYAKYSANWLGHPWHREGIEEDCFFALRPCHGRPPLRK